MGLRIIEIDLVGRFLVSYSPNQKTNPNVGFINKSCIGIGIISYLKKKTKIW